MASDRYAEFLPAILAWIQQTIDAHAGEKRLVATFKFPRLPRYFTPELLRTTSVVITEHLPRPPLSAMGLSEFASFERQPMGGITFLDTYFLEPDATENESAHFHELVHVIQWRVLGPERFLLLYADGLSQKGYLDSPLEAMAFAHQRRFDLHWPLYRVEREIEKQTLALSEPRP